MRERECVCMREREGDKERESICERGSLMLKSV